MLFYSVCPRRIRFAARAAFIMHSRDVGISHGVLEMWESRKEFCTISVECIRCDGR